MDVNALTEALFKATTEGKVSNVSNDPSGCIDIWPYVKAVQSLVSLPQEVVDGQWVEYVYRSQFNHYDHVMIPAGRYNAFLVVVVDRLHGSVLGHRILDLNAEYGLQPRESPEQGQLELG
jgi:hypothetical protein